VRTSWKLGMTVLLLKPPTHLFSTAKGQHTGGNPASASHSSFKAEVIFLAGSEDPSTVVVLMVASVVVVVVVINLQ